MTFSATIRFRAMGGLPITIGMRFPGKTDGVRRAALLCKSAPLVEAAAAGVVRQQAQGQSRHHA